MKSRLSLRLATLIICVTSAVPANAKQWQQVAPHWLDQTIFQPNCSPDDCACDCLWNGSCLPACVW
jgi:hypothetical protein